MSPREQEELERGSVRLRVAKVLRMDVGERQATGGRCPRCEESSVTFGLLGNHPATCTCGWWGSLSLLLNEHDKPHVASEVKMSEALFHRRDARELTRLQGLLADLDGLVQLGDLWGSNGLEVCSESGSVIPLTATFEEAGLGGLAKAIVRALEERRDLQQQRHELVLTELRLRRQVTDLRVENDHLRQELAELRLLEATPTDLGTSLGAGPVIVQTREEFESPPPPEPKKKRQRRARSKSS